MKEITVLLQFCPFNCYSESRVTCCSAPITPRILVISMEGWHSTYQPFFAASCFISFILLLLRVFPAKMVKPAPPDPLAPLYVSLTPHRSPYCFTSDIISPFAPPAHK